MDSNAKSGSCNPNSVPLGVRSVPAPRKEVKLNAEPTPENVSLGLCMPREGDVFTEPLNFWRISEKDRSLFPPYTKEAVENLDEETLDSVGQKVVKHRKLLNENPNNV
jgi:hypothetical protein